MVFSFLQNCSVRKLAKQKMDDDDDLAMLERTEKRHGKRQSDLNNKQTKRFREADSRTFEDGNPLTDMINSSSSGPSNDQPPGRSRRSALWASDNEADNFAFMATDGRGDQPASRPRTMMSMRPVTAQGDMDEEDVIQMIPDLADVHEEDFNQRTAQAPNVMINRLVSFTELEKDLLKHSAFSSLDGINLTPLIGRLVPEEETIEDDRAWTWDNLIADIASHLPDFVDKMDVPE